MATYHGSAGFSVPQKRNDAQGGGNFSEELTGEKIIFGEAYDVYQKKATGHLIAEKITSHFLTCCKTRGGKGVSLIIPNLLVYKGSIVVIDPKGENAWATAKYRKERLGHKVYVLDPWGEVKKRYGNRMREFIPDWWIPEQNTFNPLSILDHKNENYSEDLAYIADSIIINQSSKDPFFDDAARELVAGLIAYMVETAEQDEEPTLQGLRILLSNSSEALAKIAKEAQKLGIKSPAARKLARFTTKSTTNDNVIITAVTQTAFLDSQALNQCLKGNTKIFQSLVEYPTTIYLVLPVDKLQTYGRWLRLLVSIGIRTVSCYHGKLEVPVLFMLDEFGTIGKLSAVSQAYGLMAGLNMSVWAFVQDLTQLKDDYGTKWETFIANSQAISFWGVTDQFTADYFSKMMGTQTVEIKNVSISQSASSTENYGTSPTGATSGSSYQHGTSQSNSVQHIARPLMRPEEIREAHQNYGFLLGNHKPYVYLRTIYYKISLFSSLTEPNPNIAESIEPFLKAYCDREEDAARKQLEEIKRSFETKAPDREKIKQTIVELVPDFETAETIAKALGWKISKKLFGGVKVFKEKSGRYDFKNPDTFKMHVIEHQLDIEYTRTIKEEEERLLNLAREEFKRRDASAYARFKAIL